MHSYFAKSVLLFSFEPGLTEPRESLAGSAQEKNMQRSAADILSVVINQRHQPGQGRDEQKSATTMKQINKHEKYSS